MNILKKILKKRPISATLEEKSTPPTQDNPLGRKLDKRVTASGAGAGGIQDLRRIRNK